MTPVAGAANSPACWPLCQASKNAVEGDAGLSVIVIGFSVNTKPPVKKPSTPIRVSVGTTSSVSKMSSTSKPWICVAAGSSSGTERISTALADVMLLFAIAARSLLDQDRAEGDLLDALPIGIEQRHDGRLPRCANL